MRLLFIEIADKKKALIYEQLQRKLYHVCMLGSMDCGVSFWASNSTTPIAALKNLFKEVFFCLSHFPSQISSFSFSLSFTHTRNLYLKQTVHDVSCATDGLSFAACSMDGSVAVICFKKEEV